MSGIQQSGTDYTFQMAIVKQQSDRSGHFQNILKSVKAYRPRVTDYVGHSDNNRQPSVRVFSTVSNFQLLYLLIQWVFPHCQCVWQERENTNNLTALPLGSLETAL